MPSKLGASGAELCEAQDTLSGLGYWLSAIGYLPPVGRVPSRGAPADQIIAQPPTPN
jgi:hypothetical protein